MPTHEHQRALGANEPRQRLLEFRVKGPLARRNATR